MKKSNIILLKCYEKICMFIDLTYFMSWRGLLCQKARLNVSNSAQYVPRMRQSKKIEANIRVREYIYCNKNSWQNAAFSSSFNMR